MKIYVKDRKVRVKVSKSLLLDQCITIAYSSALIFGMMWFAPEQMGW